VTTGRGALLAASLVVAFGVAAAFVAGKGVGADGSVLSRGSRGWLAARRYLESRGTRVELLDEPLDQARLRAGMLVLVLPWQRAGWDERLDALDHRLHAGETLLVAYSGSGLPAGDAPLFRSLGLDWIEPRGRAPLDPFRWRRFAGEEWSLREDREGTERVRMAAPERIPRLPEGAAVLLRTESGAAAAFSYPRGQGRVVVVPADALSNGRLGAADNLALLEGLRSLAATWIFDEFHHGLTAVASPTAARSRRAFDLYMLHLVFLYALAVLAVVRRFGPAWREPPVIAGSTAAFLLGLATMHQRLGHHQQAAGLLLDRARELDPRIRLPRERRVTDEKSFLDLAGRVAHAQSHSRRKG
jgi:hypothetical protein